MNARLICCLAALALGFGSSARAVSFEVRQFTLPSPVQDADPPNPIIYLEYYEPTSHGKHPAVILVHHWRMNKPFAERELARELAAAGMAVAMPIMPYHMERTPPGHRSGLVMISADVPRTVRAVGQAASEIHTVADWLRARPEVDPSRIGIVGLSLGAIVASIAVGQRDDFAAVVLMLGAGDVADILWTSPSTKMVRNRLSARGYTVDRLRSELAPVEPLNCLSPRQGCKVLMLNATYDFVMPRRDTLALWNCLGRPQIVWVESGHYIVGQARNAMYGLTRDFMLCRFGMRDSFDAPSRVRIRRIKLGMALGRSPVMAIGGAVELVRVGRTPLAVDLNCTTDGLSAAGVINFGRFVTLGARRKLFSSDHRFAPYAMVHVLL